MVIPEVRPVLLYDGTCGFCARSVQFVLDAERSSHTMFFATLDGTFGTDVRGRFPLIAGADSVILYLPATGDTSERALIRSDAALWVARYLGGKWRVLAAIARVVPRPIRDAVYDLIARHRHQIAGAESCLLPTPAQRARFL